MSAAPQAPRELTLEHTSDEHTAVLAQVDALRAKGQHGLADQIERAYRANFTGRGAFKARTEAPPPPTKRRKRR